MSEAGNTWVAEIVSAAGAGAPSASPSARATILFNMTSSRCPNDARHLTIRRMTTVFSAFEQTARAHRARPFLRVLPEKLALSYAAALDRVTHIAARGVCALREGEERLITPLPLFHMNALAVSTTAMILSAGCIVQLERFHPKTWWRDVAESGATIVHYLGVMPAVLLNLPETSLDKAHCVRFGYGANANPADHAAFEERFGFPLIEAWAMTETGG